MAFYSPLRYPGGKGKLAPFVSEVFRYNGLCDGTYVEPYAGGAAVAMMLLIKGLAQNIIINDIDPRIYAFWWCVFNDTGNLCQKISETPLTVKEWENQKKIHANLDQETIADVGFATFYLNRTNRSGILDGGLIGGKKQDGPYKMDARFNREALCERIKMIAQYKRHVKLYNLDALDFLETIGSTLSLKTLLYFDPPYYNKGQMLYRNSYTPEDHALIYERIQKLSLPWIVTYDDVEPIRKLYSNENFEPFGITYSSHNSRPKGAEILFYRNLRLPSSPYTTRERRP